MKFEFNSMKNLDPIKLTIRSNLFNTHNNNGNNKYNLKILDHNNEVLIDKEENSINNIKSNINKGITTILKIRPCPKESYSVDYYIKDNKIEFFNSNLGKDNKSNKTYVFTSINNYNIDQNTFFLENFKADILSFVNNGLNSLIFTYGMTCSGKSFTIFGDKSNPGVLPRAVSFVLDIVNNSLDNDNINRNKFEEDMFSKGKEKNFNNNLKTKLFCNFFEVYNEECYDLLYNFKNNTDIGNYNKSSSVSKIKHKEELNKNNSPFKREFSNDIIKNNLNCNSDKILNFNKLSLEKNIIGNRVSCLSTTNKLEHKYKQKLLLKEIDKKINLVNINQPQIKDIEGFNSILKYGLLNKSNASTLLNKNSSRSHTIFKLIIIKEHVNNDGTINYKESYLNIVDLAGSERSKRTEAVGINLKEANKINLSLSVLGKCLEAMRQNSINNSNNCNLIDNYNFNTTINKDKKDIANIKEPKIKKQILVPYRESKLTMIFQEYFNNNYNIKMICNINPRKEDYEETLRALAFCCSCKEIIPVSRASLDTPLINKDIFNKYITSKKKNINNINKITNENNILEKDNNNNKNNTSEYLKKLYKILKDSKNINCNYNEFITYTIKSNIYDDISSETNIYQNSFNNNYVNYSYSKSNIIQTTNNLTFCAIKKRSSSLSKHKSNLLSKYIKVYKHETNNNTKLYNEIINRIKLNKKKSELKKIQLLKKKIFLKDLKLKVLNKFNL